MHLPKPAILAIVLALSSTITALPLENSNNAVEVEPIEVKATTDAHSLEARQAWWGKWCIPIMGFGTHCAGRNRGD